MKKTKRFLVLAVVLSMSFVFLTKQAAALSPPMFVIDASKMVVTDTNEIFNIAFENKIKDNVTKANIKLFKDSVAVGEWTKEFTNESSEVLKIDCDVQKDMNLTLQKGTIYTYKIDVDTMKYVDSWDLYKEGAFKTTGSVPSKFISRSAAPENDNKYYYSDKNKFYAQVQSDITKRTEWYAYGRAYEVLSEKPKMITNFISSWFTFSSLYMGGLPGSQPMEGALVCWKDHLAVVEKVEGENIVISEATSDSIFQLYQHILIRSLVFYLRNLLKTFCFLSKDSLTHIKTHIR